MHKPKIHNSLYADKLYKEYFTLKEVAWLCGRAISTVDNWAREFRIVRNRNGRFSRERTQWLILISQMRKLGIKPEQIKEMMAMKGIEPCKAFRQSAKTIIAALPEKKQAMFLGVQYSTRYGIMEKLML